VSTELLDVEISKLLVNEKKDFTVCDRGG